MPSARAAVMAAEVVRGPRRLPVAGPAVRAPLGTIALITSGSGAQYRSAIHSASPTMASERSGSSSRIAETGRASAWSDLSRTATTRPGRERAPKGTWTRTPGRMEPESSSGTLYVYRSWGSIPRVSGTTETNTGAVTASMMRAAGGAGNPARRSGGEPSGVVPRHRRA